MNRLVHGTFHALLALSLVVAAAWSLSFTNVSFSSGRGTLYVTHVPRDPSLACRVSVIEERFTDSGGDVQVALNQWLDASSWQTYRPTRAAAPTATFAGLRWWNVVAFSPASTIGVPTQRVYGVRVHLLAVPYRTLAVAILVPLVLLAGIVVKGRRRHAASTRLGLCRSCRYDLTGNVSGICPECGKEVRGPA